MNSVCDCIYPWLKNLLQKSSSLHCVYCDASLSGNPYLALACGLRCAKSSTKVHFVSMIFCTETQCGELFKREHRNDDSCVFFPFSAEFMEKFDDDLKEKLRQTVISKQPFSMSYCKSCKIFERTQCEKFKVCGICKMVRYCSEKCQKKDWSQHKSYCGAKAAKKDVPHVNPFKDRGIPCGCFNQDETTLWNRARKEICSYLECSKRTYPPYEFSFYATTCTKNTEKPHLIPTQYCSSKCHKRATLEKNE